MRKGLLLLYNGFEDCEALVTRAFLKKHNFEILTSTPNISLEVFSSQKLQVKADFLLDSVSLDDYNFLILPGGPYVKNILDHKPTDLKKILQVVQHFVNRNQVIGAICASPVFLGKLNLLKNSDFVCYPGCEKYINGNYCPSERAVTSGNFITSRSPETVFDFVKHLLNKLTNKKIN